MTESGDPNVPVAGWYEVPDQPGRKRYWDGSGWGQYWNEGSGDETGGKSRVDPNLAAIGTALFAAVLGIVAIFLPQLESTSFAQIKGNSMIQNGDGWIVLVGVVGVLVGAYRAYAGKRRTWTVFVFGVLIIAIAIYDGTGSRTELHSLASGFETVTTKGSAGIGIYAAGVAGFLAALAGLNLARGGTMLGDSIEGAKTKVCPDCAETVLAAARICKHCGHEFAPASMGEPAKPAS